MKTELLDAPEHKSIDTVVVKAMRDQYIYIPSRDTTQLDTTRVPIEFNPIVEDWKE